MSGALGTTNPMAIVALRLLYDRFFDKVSLQAPGARERLLKETDLAINRYEDGSCDAENLKAIAGPGVDCAYVGAALYSFRSGLYAQDSSWHKALDDRVRFLECAKDSAVPQAVFLEGMAEYEVSLQSRWKRWGARFAGVPSNEKHSLELVAQGLDGNASPFVDDIWFFIFDTEQNYLRQKKETGHHDGADERLLAAYSFEQVSGYLASKYPENPRLKKLISFH